MKDKEENLSHEKWHFTQKREEAERGTDGT